MLDIGFRPDIERILRRCPTQRQTLLLSATLPPPVLRLAQRYMVDPIHINLSPDKVDGREDPAVVLHGGRGPQVRAAAAASSSARSRGSASSSASASAGSNDLYRKLRAGTQARGR